MKIVIMCCTLFYSLSAFAILLPNPKFKIDENEERESLQNSAKRRAAAIKLLDGYYSAYLAELQKLNHSDIDPNLRSNVILAGKNASDDLLHVPAAITLKSLRAHLNEAIANPTISDNGLQTALSSFTASAMNTEQKFTQLEDGVNSLIADSQIERILHKLAPSQNQKFANIILGELFLILALISLRKKS